MTLSPRITPHLWYDKQAKEAAEFYSGLFQNARIHSVRTLRDTPSGDFETVSLELCGQPFTFMSAGPMFKFTPAVSFLVACTATEEVDALARALIDGGSALMPLGTYGFSERFAWVHDRYGVSWQLMFAGAAKQHITPTLMFVGAQCGRAEEAVRFYASVLRDARVGDILRYGSDEPPDSEGTVKHAAFTLEGQAFAAMDSAHAHQFTFSEAISFMVNCDTQADIDYYWDALSADPSAEACGWLKDKFGVSWQITPSALGVMMSDPDQHRVDRVTQAFLPMKKLDLAVLQKAFDGN
jgi:predicted 3-demethylubiquinone-9 3-methyltransferase (glyoxalase superfamily)